MNLAELFLTAVALSMDAFAVAICKGLSMKKVTFKKSLIIGLYFGIFQALMPLIGFLVGSQFANKIETFDHWIAFILLAAIGLNMIKESREKEKIQEGEPKLNPKTMLPLALATSIDALAVGVSFALIQVDIVPAVSFIGIITLILSMAGVKIGSVFGNKYKSKAEFIGGIILICMGGKILFEHLNLLDKIGNLF